MFSNHKIWVSMATVLLWYLGRANNSVLSCQKLLPWALFHFFFIPDLSLSLCLLCFISSYFSLYSSTSFSLPPLTSHPLKILAHPKLLSTILSHAGRGVTVLNMIVRWAPPFCQKLELKSETHSWVLEPNTLLRDIWVIIGIEIWVMGCKFEL